MFDSTDDLLFFLVGVSRAGRCTHVLNSRRGWVVMEFCRLHDTFFIAVGLVAAGVELIDRCCCTLIDKLRMPFVGSDQRPRKNPFENGVRIHDVRAIAAEFR